MSPRVTVQSNRPIKHVTNVSVSGVTVNRYWFIDPPFFCFRFVSTKALTQVLCPLRVINISSSQQHPSIFYTVSHLFLLCDRPLPLSGFVLVPLVSAQANLPHRHSFGLLFHPPTLGKTVCSKDCNLTANLYGFLQGRALSLAEWFAKDVETPRSLTSSLQVELEGRSFHTHSDVPAVTSGVVKRRSQKVCQVVFV